MLERLSEFKPIVPLLWFYELGNSLTMACRRKRITYEQATEYLGRIRNLSITPHSADPALILARPGLARKYELTNYDAAYWTLPSEERFLLPPLTVHYDAPPSKLVFPWQLQRSDRHRWSRDLCSG